jgi:hypothetical protein
MKYSTLALVAQLLAVSATPFQLEKKDVSAPEPAQPQNAYSLARHQYEH